MSDANREAPEERDGATRLARLHLWQIQGVRDVVVVAVVLAIVYLGYAMRSVSVPLLVAFGLAYLVEPVVQGLVRRFNMTRTAAVGTLMGTAGVALVAVRWASAPRAWRRCVGARRPRRRRRRRRSCGCPPRLG